MGQGRQQMPIRQVLATFSTIPSSDLSPDGSQIGRPPPRRIFRLVPPPLHWWHHGGQRDRPGFRTKAATACATFALPGPYLHKSAFARISNINTQTRIHLYNCMNTPELIFGKCGPIHSTQNDQPISQNTGHCTEEKEWLEPSTFSMIQNLYLPGYQRSFFLPLCAINPTTHHMHICIHEDHTLHPAPALRKCAKVFKNAHVLFCVHCAQDLV